jgi:hypothetical protein
MVSAGVTLLAAAVLCAPVAGTYLPRTLQAIDLQQQQQPDASLMRSARSLRTEHVSPSSLKIEFYYEDAPGRSNKDTNYLEDKLMPAAATFLSRSIRVRMLGQFTSHQLEWRCVCRNVASACMTSGLQTRTHAGTALAWRPVLHAHDVLKCVTPFPAAGPQRQWLYELQWQEGLQGQGDTQAQSR